MANKNPENQITPDKRKSMPPRGKSKKNLILDAIREMSLLQLSSEASREDAEKAVFGFLAEAAFNPTEDTSTVANTCLNQLMKKGWPDVKPIMPMVEFEFDQEGTHLDKATQILSAVAKGDISPDVANMLIGSIASMMKIAEITDLEERIKQLESSIND